MKTGITIIFLIGLVLAGCQPEPKNTEIDDGKALRFERGKELYETSNCGHCHLTNKLCIIGPKIGNATQKYEKEWLYKWIRNSQTLLVNGDPIAEKIHLEYNKLAHPEYPDLTNENIDDIFFYIDSLNNI